MRGVAVTLTYGGSQACTGDMHFKQCCCKTCGISNMDKYDWHHLQMHRYLTDHGDVDTSNNTVERP